ncbi:hypothetical protein NliqN6_3020 [Naganishia liquefaciens]|uniref:Uncharacterized protein n=1 Tax=Naganishia liquefaciens TaxID=104408 RepID=A0A8H3YEU9_9TREE|nr:hypothetical protein NliqN6_3020 [Naganishia liquefaciens]
MAHNSSDLDFLNETLSQSAKPRPSASTVPNDRDLPPNPATSNGSSSALEDAGIPADILKSLEGLSAEEREAFAPLLQALSSSTDIADGTNGSSGDSNIDAKDVEELLKQFDAAGSVADTLEGKLDRLLESLGQVEEAFPEEQNVAGRVQGRTGESEMVPQQLPETMTGEAQKAFEEVAKDRE